MGCAISSPLSKKRLRYLTSGGGGGGRGNDRDAVWLCSERKRLVKKAVKQRQSFADGERATIEEEKGKGGRRRLRAN